MVLVSIIGRCHSLVDGVLGEFWLVASVNPSFRQLQLWSDNAMRSSVYAIRCGNFNLRWHWQVARSITYGSDNQTILRQMPQLNRSCLVWNWPCATPSQLEVHRLACLHNVTKFCFGLCYIAIWCRLKFSQVYEGVWQFILCVLIPTVEHIH